MNHIYRVIFNRHTNTFQAVAETAKSQGKTHSQKSSNSSTVVSKLVLRPLSVVIGLLVGSVAVATPTGGEVVAGVANIHQAGNITNINQSSQNAAINWQQFGIKAHETVNFNQPNVNAVTLNRVIGNEKSVIDGAMNANGKVFIQNANGTLIGKNAQINVGGLVATTAKISDEDFMSGNYRFTGATGSIENLGDIKVPKGGVVALIAPIVKNSGTITAHGADTLLASAESFSITLPNDGQFSYTLDKGTLQGLVDNGGAILADGGRVVLTTKGIDTVKKSIIKHSGVIEANTIKNNNGVIELLGDLDNSELHLTGSLKAEGKGTDDGGYIETSAAKLNIDDQAHISTQSEQGKTGTWLIDPKDFTVAPKGGDTTGAKVSQGLKKNNVQLKSKSGAKDGKGDVIINDTISWNKNKLTLTADNDIHINKTLNGTGTASLALEYGQRTADGKENDYHIKNGEKINLPEGRNLSIRSYLNKNPIQFQVIHSLPKKDSNYTFFEEYIAIGKDISLSESSKDKKFSGYIFKKNNINLYGLGHNFENLIIDSSTNNVGLFKETSKANVRDINLNNVNIKNIGDNTGSLIGKIHGEANIKNVIVSGNIVGRNYTGGLLGYAPNADMESIIVRGKVSGNHSVGGLSGVVKNINNVGFIGEVLATGDNIGGISGIAMGDVFNSLSGTIIKGQSEKINLVKVVGKNNVGGLVGSTADNSIIRSYATGNVIGHNNVGGLIGNDTDDGIKATISESYFVGDVQGVNNVGGLGGYDVDNIDNSYVIGTISGKNNVGGLVGDGLGYMNVNYTYFNGKINAEGNKGNLFGKEDYDYQYNHNYYNRDVNKLMGRYGDGVTLEQMKKQSTFKKWDFNNKWRIENGRDTPRLKNVINIEEIGRSRLSFVDYKKHIPNKKSDIKNNKSFVRNLENSIKKDYDYTYNKYKDMNIYELSDMLVSIISGNNIDLAISDKTRIEVITDILSDKLGKTVIYMSGGIIKNSNLKDSKLIAKKIKKILRDELKDHKTIKGRSNLFMGLVRDKIVEYITESLIISSRDFIIEKLKLSGSGVDATIFISEVAKPIVNEYAKTSIDVLFSNKSLNIEKMALEFKTKLLINLSIYTVSTSIKATEKYFEGLSEYQKLLDSEENNIEMIFNGFKQVEILEKMQEFDTSKKIKGILEEYRPNDGNLAYKLHEVRNNKYIHDVHVYLAKAKYYESIGKKDEAMGLLFKIDVIAGFNDGKHTSLYSINKNGSINYDYNIFPDDRITNHYNKHRNYLRKMANRMNMQHSLTAMRISMLNRDIANKLILEEAKIRGFKPIQISNKDKNKNVFEWSNMY